MNNYPYNIIHKNWLMISILYILIYWFVNPVFIIAKINNDNIMNNFKNIYNKVMELEGGYTLHIIKYDRGDMTYAGISRKFWSNWEGWKKIDNNKFDSKLKFMVIKFYKVNFWDNFNGDKIKSKKIAYNIYESAINSGVKVTVKMVQKILNVKIDGILGNNTLHKLNKINEQNFIYEFMLLKIFRYKNICWNDKSQLKFLVGWINRVQRVYNNY